ncbi:methyltransferase type 11 [Gaertneriomyces semiglobifer]|nr:methyltransferase type 11 [Gaertneriomyces semiglobifer]
MSFKDCFSTQSKTYAQFRPDYPPALYEFLTTLTKSHALVWDCATGSGQAAIALAQHFEKVVATDASASQIEQARKADNVEYRVATAEASGLAPASVDLVTVAQAVHWFDIEGFYKEVRRVVKPGGAIAVWTYSSLPSISPEIDSVLSEYYSMMTPYWAFDISIVDNSYRDLPFPFENLCKGDHEEFPSHLDWTLDTVFGYLRSWSGTQAYIRKHGSDPVNSYEDRVRKAWGNPEDVKKATFVMIVRAGRV